MASQQPELPKASGLFKTPDGKTIEIRDVWAHNLEAEMEHIREILDKYPYVAMVSEWTLDELWMNNLMVVLMIMLMWCLVW
jgi:hypothetical protein